MTKREEQIYEQFIVKNMRKQYKIPDSVQDIPTIKEWMRRMGASKFMIRRMEEAMKHANAKENL